MAGRSTSDSAGAQTILDTIRKRWPWLKHLFDEGAYDHSKLMDQAAFRAFVLEIVRRVDKEPDFKMLPRGVVARTGPRLGWRYPEIELAGANGNWLGNVDHAVEDTNDDGDSALLAVG